MPSPGETLIRVRQRAARWMEFDDHWYQDRYFNGPAIDDPLADYLTNGQRLGRSPNVFFDETFYLRRYPDVARAVQDGAYQSGFDHYCRDGLLTHAPHWLFDPDFYRLQLPDAPVEGVYVNGYDHFLRVGCDDGRMGHPLFDPTFYGIAADIKNAVGATPASAYAHFVYLTYEQQRDVDTSLYFDSAWYRANYPSVAQAIAAGEFLCSLEHYLCNNTPTAFDAVVDFSEADYLSRYPDVAEAVARGIFRNGYMHFLRSGAFELRDPSRHIDLRSYWNHNDAVRRAVHSKSVRDAFAYVLLERRGKRLAHAETAPVPPLDEQATRTLFAAQARDLLPLYGRRPIDFTPSEPLICSAIVVLLDHLHLSLQAIASLRQNHPGAIELILVDPGTADDVRHIERYVIGASLLKFRDNIGLIAAGNAALGSVTTGRLLYLASDGQLAPGAVATALARLDSDPAIGAVGGKIIGSDELLQEAGGIVWRDGSTSSYMNGAAPLCPEAGFARDVDFCSIACLMVRTALVRRLGGLDIAMVPDRAAEADLGLRIRQSEYRVVYDPSVVLHRYTAGGTDDSKGLLDKHNSGESLLFTKHSATLRLKHAASSLALPLARSVDRGRRRILFIEDTVPLRLPSSAYRRANDIVAILAALDYCVTVFPMIAANADPAAIAADLPDTVEVLHDQSQRGFRTFLASRPGYYDAIWISRTSNLDLIRPLLDDATLVPASTRIILDVEAVATTRDISRAQAFDQPLTGSLHDALKNEFRNALHCHHVLAVSEQESRLLSSTGLPNVQVLGAMRDVEPTPRPWSKRSGLLFLGDLRDEGAPDLDALFWFADEVLPRIDSELGYEGQLTVAGDLSPWSTVERITNNSRILLAGPAVNLPTLYDSHRLVVAPTRFASGIPYRVYEAASFGVPVVATSLLCQQMGWKDNTELLATDAGDPSGFAARVVALYRSEILWTRLREAAMARLRRDNDRSLYTQKIQALLPAHHSSDDTGAEKPAIASASRPAIRSRPSFSQGSCQT